MPDISSDSDIGPELDKLGAMTVGQLQEHYALVFGERTNAAHKAWLVKRIAWRLQALAEGGLSQRARQRAEELARDADLRLLPPGATDRHIRRLTGQMDDEARDPRLPPAGSILARRYKGQTVEVIIENNGFRFGGELYRSLSAVARAITGSHVNGFQFFRLGRWSRR
jgi:Protein of unknown function (DUF2924)